MQHCSTVAVYIYTTLKRLGGNRNTSFPEITAEGDSKGKGGKPGGRGFLCRHGSCSRSVYVHASRASAHELRRYALSCQGQEVHPVAPAVQDEDRWKLTRSPLLQNSYVGMHM